MVSVTFETLEENLPKFIEEVLTNNIVDPISPNRPSNERFIYKDSPSRLANNYPYIIVELTDLEEVFLDEGSKIVIPREFTIDITVIAKKTAERNNPKYDRDYYTSQIKSVLRDADSENHEGKSISGESIRIFSLSSRRADTYTGDGEIVRIKELAVRGHYYGG
jgi:hypothetical protein